MNDIKNRKDMYKKDEREIATDGQLEGINAVSEAIRAGKTIDKIFISRERINGTVEMLVSKAKANGAVISECDRRKLDMMSRTGAHQGIIAVMAQREYSTIDEVLEIAKQSGRDPLIVVCDEITDPQNLGAIIRTAEACGAHGVIIPKHRSAGLTATVSKASAGALEHMAVVRVTNIVNALKELKEKGVWVFGSDGDGDVSVFDADYKRPCAVIIGSEGEGMGRLVRKECDFVLSIPMYGKTNSLNASAAAAVLLYSAVRIRNM